MQMAIRTHLEAEERAQQAPQDPRAVQLDRTKGKLGLKIATPSQAPHGALPIITEIYQDGSAAQEELLQLYDCIESVRLLRLVVLDRPLTRCHGCRSTGSRAVVLAMTL